MQVLAVKIISGQHIQARPASARPASLVPRPFEQTARFLILILEPLSIGLAVAISAVWQKPAEKLAGKIPETGALVKTAIPAKTANADKSNSYKSENAELHEIKEKFGLTEERIARITGRNKVETVLQWLNNEKEIPEKALRELRKWSRLKNKVISIKEAPYGI